MDLGTAERLASIADPKAVSALEARRADPAVKKAVAEQFGTLLLERVLQNSDGEALAMTGGAGGGIVNALFASTIAETAMSGDRLGLADMLFRSIAATQTPPPSAGAAAQLAVPAAQYPPSAAVRALTLPSRGGFPLSPYWQAGGLRPLAHGPADMPIEPPGSPVAGLLARPATGAGAASRASLPSDTPPEAAGGSSPAGPASGHGAGIGTFVRQVGPVLQWAAGQLGVSPRVLLAQAALESGWGRSMVGNNLFGIKAGSPSAQPQISAPTHEVENGQRVTERASFRAYASLDAAVEDYVSLIAGSHRYHQAIGLGDDARAYGAALVRGGYATDSDYAEKLAAVAASPLLAAAMAALPPPDQPRLAAAAG